TAIIGVHNGTIRDWSLDKLSEATDVNISHILNDSKAMFTMMSSSPENLRLVLSRYSGAAAMVWVDTKNPNDVYVWSGAEVFGKKEQERELHYLETKEGIFISSEVTPLETVTLMKGFQSGYILDFPSQF